ncbi:2-oxo acid dehydrogenase subunit E2 [Bacillus sp. B15-48]|uniref:2-oxo acid dehydrogenase subunit E2 n=1 Tax=Bacillus sp. B15-48 TaxID=1548601 RepID=UPI00193F02F7|nr:2-oxo acid dehydrogenase subunit E2 [Bacillus sp. B15-48]
MTKVKESKTIKLRGMRRTIAKRMFESISSSAQLTLHSTMEIPELAAFKKEHHLSYTDLFLKAVALTLKNHPNLNASLVDNVIHLWPTINIGLAISLDNGLVVPAIFDADEKTFTELAKARRDVTTRSELGELTPEEVNSGTFTISNLGLYPIDGFTPILNPPQVGLLGVGRIQGLPRFVNGELKEVPVIHLSLTIDHRVVDGAPGAAFLQDLEDLFRHPDRMLKES